MIIERVNPAELPKPTGFSHAVAVSELGAGGRLVFLAGQTALNSGGVITGDDVAAQFRLALGNLLTALRAAGGGPEHLVSLTIYAVNLPGYRASGKEIGAVWRELAGRDYPAMAAVGVAGLWDPEALVEVQGYAVLP